MLYISEGEVQLVFAKETHFLENLVYAVMGNLRGMIDVLLGFLQFRPDLCKHGLCVNISDGYPVCFRYYVTNVRVLTTNEQILILLNQIFLGHLGSGTLHLLEFLQVLLPQSLILSDQLRVDLETRIEIKRHVIIIRGCLLRVQRQLIKKELETVRWRYVLPVHVKVFLLVVGRGVIIIELVVVIIPRVLLMRLMGRLIASLLEGVV